MSATGLSVSVLAYVPPSVLFRRRATIIAGVVAFVSAAGIYLNFKPWMLFTDFHHLVRLADEMIPPNVALLWRKTALYQSVAETVAMAFLGTLVGGVGVCAAVAGVCCVGVCCHCFLPAALMAAPNPDPLQPSKAACHPLGFLSCQASCDARLVGRPEHRVM